MHVKYLLAALKLAEQGRGSCAPNPSVGAIAVQNETIIAQAWHRGAGTLHAEQLLLTQFPPNTPEVILYTTLEPCNHWGRTPPCVDAIIKHGIKEVVFAYKDPNPLVAENDSTALLSEHGIRVHHCPLPEIDDFYVSYTHWLKTKMPWVTVKIAQTLDGMIGRKEGERLILSNTFCQNFTHEMRRQSDILLTSAKTIKRDNPLMNVRLKEREESKPLAIIDSDLSLSPDARIFNSTEHCHIFFDGQYKDKVNTVHYPNSSFYTVQSANASLDLKKIISHIGLLGYHDVFVEVGASLFTALHREGLVNRTYLYIVPQYLGKDALCAYQDKDTLKRPKNISWHAQDDNMIACLDWET